jgi:hypothetical protein
MALQLKASVKGFGSNFGVDVRKNFEEGKIVRLGFGNSAVSKYNRLLERHVSRDGAYWVSYDFDGNSGLKDIFRLPLGPFGPAAVSFKHVASEVIFSLPNGLQGYWLEKADGTPLSVAPIEVVSDYTQRERQIINGIGCMGCHTGGLHIKFDAVREIVAKSPNSFVNADLEKINRVFRSRDELERLFEEDRTRYLRSLGELGVIEQPGSPKDVIRLLVDRFEIDLRLKDAAAELGVTEERLEGIASQEAKANFIVSRLKYGGMPRDTFTSEFRFLASKLPN